MENNKKEIQLKNPATCEHYKELGCVKAICECYTLVPKKETIEDIALKLFPDKSFWIGSGDTSRLYDPNQSDRERWIQGAKWQEETYKQFTMSMDSLNSSRDGYLKAKREYEEARQTMYSEEEVIQIIRDFKYDCIHIGEMNFDKWFEVFKKK
jgi:hypothetical protein